VLLNDGDEIEYMDFPDYHQKGQTAGTGQGLKDTVAGQVKSLESNVIKRALKLHKGNISGAAKELKITRKTLYEKIRQYNL
jgi:transcriptional regulator of acetoin/glycerol metabolism